MFDSPGRLLLGLVSGIAFGFLLQKGRVAKFDVILGQLLLRDWTVLRVMATAVAVGAIGVYALRELGWIELEIKPARFGGVALGGALFGGGMALLGYCPGTAVAACGEGRRDALMGVVGMLAGAGAYVAAYPVLWPLPGALADWGRVTWPEVTHTPFWPWLALLAGGVAVVLLALSRGARAPGGSPAR